MGGGGIAVDFYTAAISGQGGGRILPGAASTANLSGFDASQSGWPTTPFLAVPGPVDNRVNTAHTYHMTVNQQPFLTNTSQNNSGTFISGAQQSVTGGGPGSAGASADFIIHYWNVNGVATPVRGWGGGGGGGWGAAGGSGIVFTGTDTTGNGGTSSTIAGGAGGKAIDTQCHAVTWIAGSNRSYGAVG